MRTILKVCTNISAKKIQRLEAPLKFRIQRIFELCENLFMYEGLLGGIFYTLKANSAAQNILRVCGWLTGEP